MYITPKKFRAKFTDPPVSATPTDYYKFQLYDQFGVAVGASINLTDTEFPLDTVDGYRKAAFADFRPLTPGTDYYVAISAGSNNPGDGESAVVNSAIFSAVAVAEPPDAPIIVDVE